MVKSKLSTFIFNGLEKDAYLNELYKRLLKHYGLKIFNLRNTEEYNINDLLRFSDLLSHSVDSKKSDLHKNIAQSIVSILALLYPNDKKIAFYRKRVLKNVKNYAALNNTSSENFEIKSSGDYLMNYFFEEYQKDSLRVPGSENLNFIGSQKEVFDKLNSDFISFSAPTSMGKSFLMRIFMKNKIINGENRDFALVVPTKALINETYIKVINDFRNELSERNYRVIRSVNEIQSNDNHSHIFIMTPERLIYLLMSEVECNLGYVFIDESQRISTKDTRSTYYYQVIDLLQKEDPAPLISFASPNIPNPQIYLELISREGRKSSRRIGFSPVNQIYFTIDYREMKIKCFNNLENKFFDICPFESKNILDAITFLDKVDDGTQSLIYCNKTSDAISYAIEMSKKVKFKINDSVLEKLASKISNEIHADYYLAELVRKGIAFHVGYLPENIRNDIEEAYRSKHINVIFCTSTLMEGVNLPANNLFVTSIKNGMKNYNEIDFYNLNGRIGRLEYTMIGNVFLVIRNDKDYSRFNSLLTGSIPKQKLSVEKAINRSNIEKIKKSLLQGDITLKSIYDTESYSNSSELRKYTLIFLSDLQSNTYGIVRKNFDKYLTEAEEQTIRNKIEEKYPKQKIDEDINVSLDQSVTIRGMISAGEIFPTVTANGPKYTETLEFLEKLAVAYNWDQYERNDLGKKTNGEYRQLRWYTVILIQWIAGYGLSNILKKSIDYRKNNPHNALWINGNYEDYEGTKRQNNIIINDTLKVLQRQVLFKLSNYFLKYIKEYKLYYHTDLIQNDWYEFVEYGTSNRFRIWLQKNGFSREVSSFIDNHPEYYFHEDGKYLVSTELRKVKGDVGTQTRRIYFNRPEIFYDE